MTTRVLVAGIGNIFLSDDAFGSEVARRLDVGPPLPADVTVADFGIRGIHLAYELLDGYEALLLVDATQRGGEPGTLYVMEVGEADEGSFGPPDPHGMDPGAMIDHIRSLGRTDLEIIVLGCEPASLAEEMGLSEPVAAAVDEAVRMVHELVSAGGRLGRAAGSAVRTA